MTTTYNWLGVLDFLQSQFNKNQLKDKEWAFERQTMLNKITKLEAEAKMQQVVHMDLMKRIQMLEYALREGRTEKSVARKTSIDYNVHDKPEEGEVDIKKLNKSENKQFLDKILNEIGIELDQQTAVLRAVEDKVDQRTVYNLVSHLDGVRQVFYSPVSQCLTSVSQDCLIKFWDLSALDTRSDVEAKISIREHTGPLFTTTGTPPDSQNNLVFSGGSEGIIKVWQAPTFKSQSSSDYSELTKGAFLNYNGEQEQTAIWQLAYLQDRLASTSSDSTIKIHSLSYEYKNSKLSTVKSNIVKTIENKDKHSNTILNPTCVSWISSNSIVNGYNNSNTISIWDLNAQKVSETLKYPVDSQPNSVYNQTNRIVMNSMMGMLLCANQDNCIRAYDVGTKKLIKKLEHGDSVTSLSLSSRKKWCLYAASHDGSIKVWDLRNNLCLEEIKKVHMKKYSESIHSLLYVDDLYSIITAGADGLIKIHQI